MRSAIAAFLKSRFASLAATLKEKLLTTRPSGLVDMRTRYIVCYDVSDPKRLRHVFRKMKGFGNHLQFSVFACDLSPQRRIELEAALSEIINHREDRVMIANV